MKVREIMTTDITSATPDTTLEDVARMMKDEDVGAIPVLEDGELRGIITDRDIVVRGIAEGLDPSESTADDVISEEVHTIEPDADAEEAARLMSERQIRRLPVVEEGELVGIVAIGDIAVKQGDERVSGEALEEVSKGVKQQGGRRSAGGTSKQHGSRGQSESKGRLQMISNRREDEEQGRQARVAPKRAQAKGRGRRRA